MNKAKEFFTNKKFYFIWAVLFSLVFIYGSYAFYYTFLEWTNLVFVGLNALLQAVSVGVLSLLFAASGKKSSTKKNLITAAVGIAVFEALMWGILTIVNKDGLYNKKAIWTAYAVCLTLYAVLFVITMFRAAKGGFKPLQSLVGIVGIVFYAGLVLLTGYKYIPLDFTYPVYRAAVGYEGKIDGIDLSAGFAYSTQKIRPTDNIADAKGQIFLAKGEREGIQFMLATKEKGREATVTVTDFTDGKGNTMPVKLYSEVYTSVPGFGNIFGDEFADALIPCENAVTLEKNRISAFYIDTVSSRDQAPGEYTAEVTVKSNGEEKKFPLTATVWNFALPETPSTETAIGISSSNLYELNKVPDNDEARRALYKSYYDLMLGHRISPYNLPVDILDDAADEYMSNPLVTSFCVPYSSDDAVLRAYYEKVTSNPEWAKKAYFYPIDEPNDIEAYDTYNGMIQRLSTLCPGFNMVTPFCTPKIEMDGEEKSAVELQSGKSSILCGCSDVVTGGTILEEMKKSREDAGSRLWWYVCCGPRNEYNTLGEDTLWNNMFIYLDAICHRELFWQEKQCGLDGFLYWDAAYYDKGNPWETSKTWDDFNCAGDGCLIYPGGYKGIDSPVATIRLKNICDGIEDYDYLTLAEERFGADFVNEQIEKITTDINHFNMDYEVLAQVRNAIGEALSN